MIEKLNAHLYKDTTDMFEDCREKINELVDVVNDLIFCINNDIPYNLQQVKTEPDDPYAEQRKWIGKLCKFRDKYQDEVWEYGILEIVENVDYAIDSAFRSSDGYWYDICEPVKPDDDIIYKGEEK